MRRYERGRNKEYQVKGKLEKRGYFVIRSAGSHSPCDLVAVKNKHILCVQVGKFKDKIRKAKDYIVMIPPLMRLFITDGKRFAYFYNGRKREGKLR